MANIGIVPGADGTQLRERPSAKPLHMRDSDAAKQKVLELNEQEDSKNERDKKTYGRTPDGTGKYRLRESIIRPVSSVRPQPWCAHVRTDHCRL